MKEAERLGLGVDLTLGQRVAVRRPLAQIRTHGEKTGHRKNAVFPPGKKNRIIRDSDTGPVECVVIESGGKNMLIEPEGANRFKNMDRARRGAKRIYRPAWAFTGQDVKRAAPGSEGLALDHFSKPAFLNYTEPFDRVLGQTGGLRPRSVFNDSYEVYGADGTPGIFDEFEKFHGL